ncbi:MAG TPA: type II toxin-antitoxin system PemK/MazF family toxin [Myxococcales bacterium]|nr:type II toxin-antitoxin system PemK/MazF family toxin [Myxococcales bacterium]
MRQYEIRWAILPEPVGRRPVLLLSRDAAYEYLRKIIVAEVTTRIRGIPQELTLGSREGLNRPSVANLDNIHTITIDEVGDRIGMLRRSRVPELKRALGFALGWPELTLPEL